MENRIWLKGDTHLHTCNSDGKLTPGQLVEACQQAGLDQELAFPDDAKSERGYVFRLYA